MRAQLICLALGVLTGCVSSEPTTITRYQTLSLGGCEDQEVTVLSKRGKSPQGPVPYLEQEQSQVCSAFIDLRYMNKLETE